MNIRETSTLTVTQSLFYTENRPSTQTREKSCTKYLCNMGLLKGLQKKFPCEDKM